MTARGQVLKDGLAFVGKECSTACTKLLISLSSFFPRRYDIAYSSIFILFPPRPVTEMFNAPIKDTYAALRE